MVVGVSGAIWKLPGLVPTEKRQVVWVVPQGMAGSPLPQPRHLAGGCKRCGCRYWLPLPVQRGGGPELGRDGRPNSHLQVAPSRKPLGQERLRPGQTRPLLLAQVWLGVMGRCSPHPPGATWSRCAQGTSFPSPCLFRRAPRRHSTRFLLLSLSCLVLAVCKVII